MEVEELKDSVHHEGYLCYSCVYFVKAHHCAIVTDEGIWYTGKLIGSYIYSWIMLEYAK